MMLFLVQEIYQKLLSNTKNIINGALPKTELENSYGIRVKKILHSEATTPIPDILYNQMTQEEKDKPFVVSISGVGKTYFFIEKYKEELAKKQIAYISLFGQEIKTNIVLQPQKLF